VLQLIAEGKSNAEIAEILVLFKSAVSTYRSRIMNKLDLEDAAALMKFAVEYSGMLAQGNAAAKRGNKKTSSG
jgi:DNA-binding NarL/FixJ family response regulator